jgi:hypothetical protein
VVVLGCALFFELLVKLQNTSNGLLGTEDEWQAYERALYILRFFRFPAFEPMQIPLSPIVAPPGPALAMTLSVLLLGPNPLLVSYVGALIGGSVFVALFFAARSLLAGNPNRDALALCAVALAALVSPLIIRMELFLGETLAFVLLLVAIRLYATSRFPLTALLLILIGFMEEFTTVIALGVILISGILSYLVSRDAKKLGWSALLVLVGLIPELVLFYAQGPQYRVSFVSGGLFPYVNVLTNLEMILQFCGVVVPLFGAVGFLLIVKQVVNRKTPFQQIVLFVWFGVSALYSVFPPLLPGVALWRTFDYLALPASILGAYCISVLAQKAQRVLLACSLLLLALPIAYLYLLGRAAVIDYIVSLISSDVRLGNALLVCVSIVMITVSFGVLLWRLGFSKRVGRKALVAFAIIFGVMFLQVSFYSPFETQFYSSYLTTNETTFLMSESHSLPANSVLATDFVLAPNVAALANRTVKDLPAYPTSSQNIFSNIGNASIYSDQFPPEGVVPTPLEVQIQSGQPVYLVVLVGNPGILYTSPVVLNELQTDSRFTMVGSSENLYLFSVSMG